MRTFLAAGLAVALAGCAAAPVVPVAPVIACPQPSSETTVVAPALGRVPELPTDPSLAVGVLANVVAEDAAAYAGEVGRRAALVKYGVEKCGWTG